MVLSLAAASSCVGSCAGSVSSHRTNGERSNTPGPSRDPGGKEEDEEEDEEVEEEEDEDEDVGDGSSAEETEASAMAAMSAAAAATSFKHTTLTASPHALAALSTQPQNSTLFKKRRGWWNETITPKEPCRTYC